MVDHGLNEIYHIRAEQGKMPSLNRKKDYNNVVMKILCLSSLSRLSVFIPQRQLWFTSNAPQTDFCRSVQETL